MVFEQCEEGSCGQWRAGQIKNENVLDSFESGTFSLNSPPPELLKAELNRDRKER